MRVAIVESIRRRPLPKGDSSHEFEELDDIREVVGGVIGRLERLEEERDFYKELLDAPGTPREIGPSAAEEDATN